MILKELNLISFGKFQNKTIHLEEGLNILYGENESGKTTIHNFIDGMFYGFLKPYAKRRNYLEGLEKYRPWNNQNYAGVLKLLQEGKVYRIERDFEKGKVKVYDDLVGIDVTDKIDKGEKLKDNLPGIYFFDFNNMVYNNTISIKQLENKIESDLSKELGDRLANISTSLDDDISVKNAINKLDKKLDAIGTEKAYTKPYGKAINELNDLIVYRRKLMESKEEYNRQIIESFKLKEEIEKQENKLEELNNKLKQLEILEKKKIYEEGINIKSELKKIDEEITNFKKYSELSFDDYALAIKLEGDKEYISKEIQKLNNTLEEIEKELNTAIKEVDENIINGIDVEKFYSDLDNFDEIEEEKNNIMINREQNKLDLLNSEIRDKKHKGKSLRTSMIMFFILSIVSIGLVFVNPLFIAFPIVLGVLAFIRRNLYKEIISETEKISIEFEDIEKSEKERDKRLIDIESFQKELLEKYNCNSKLELKKLKEDIYFKDRNYRIKKEEIKKLQENRDKVTLNLNTSKDSIQRSREEMERIKRENNVKDLEDFKLGLDKKKKYEELIKEKESKIQILEKTLGDSTLEEIQEEIKSYDYEDLIDIEYVDKFELIQEIENIKFNLQKYWDTNSRLEERIENLNRDVKEFLLVEEEIERLKTEIKNYENEIKSINISKETIENISKEIHHQFAPTINKEVSEIINIISDGRYNEVKVDEDLNISIENPMTQEIVPIDSLSGGTMDQLYFALRFSIISSIKGQSLPLILDDCFIQYDDERLRNIIEYLHQISHERQIILFTCHHRERQILDEIGLKYNLIKLSH